jgi:hypothetical protein
VGFPLADSTLADSVLADSALVESVLAVSALESLFALANSRLLPDKTPYMCEGTNFELV